MTNPGPTDIDTDELRLEAPPQAESIGMARLFAGAIARHHGCDEDAVDDIKIAISESVTNAVKAHQGMANPAPVAVVARVEDGRLTFMIVDEGGGIDATHLERLESGATPPAGLFEGSLGLTVIKSLFEDCEITRSDHGTIVRFSVALP